jgi:hypothetical protein
VPDFLIRLSRQGAMAPFFVPVKGLRSGDPMPKEAAFYLP